MYGTGATGLQLIDPKTSAIVCDKDNLSIKFISDVNSEFKTTISGSAEYSNELKGFGINQNKMFKREEAIKLIRFNRLCFVNYQEQDNLLKALQTMKVGVTKDVNASSDNRGNYSGGISKVLSSGIPENFNLNIPIFKGEDKSSFTVDICMDESDGGGLRIWFESVELKELIDKKKDDLFNSELDKIKDLNIYTLFK